jgi:hypothetical protein
MNGEEPSHVPACVLRRVIEVRAILVHQGDFFKRIS